MHEHLKIAYDALVKMEGVPEVPPPPAPGHHDSKQYPELDCQTQVLALPNAEPAAGLSGVSAESPAATVEQEEKTDVDQQPEGPDWGDDQKDGVEDREKAEEVDSDDESDFEESQFDGMS